MNLTSTVMASDHYYFIMYYKQFLLDSSKWQVRKLTALPLLCHNTDQKGDF